MVKNGYERMKHNNLGEDNLCSNILDGPFRITNREPYEISDNALIKDFKRSNS